MLQSEQHRYRHHHPLPQRAATLGIPAQTRGIAGKDNHLHYCGSPVQALRRTGATTTRRTVFLLMGSQSRATLFASRCGRSLCSEDSGQGSKAPVLCSASRTTSHASVCGVFCRGRPRSISWSGSLSTRPRPWATLSRTCSGLRAALHSPSGRSRL